VTSTIAAYTTVCPVTETQSAIATPASVKASIPWTTSISYTTPTIAISSSAAEESECTYTSKPTISFTSTPTSTNFWIPAVTSVASSAGVPYTHSTVPVGSGASYISQTTKGGATPTTTLTPFTGSAGKLKAGLLAGVGGIIVAAVPLF